MDEINSRGLRRTAGRLASVALASAIFAVASPAALDAQVSHDLTPRAAPLSASEMQNVAATATPAFRGVEPVAGAQLEHPGPAHTQQHADDGPPRMREGNQGARIGRSRIGPEDMQPLDQGMMEMETLPQNYGLDQFNTLYHYNDYLLRPLPARWFPTRAVGRMFFRFPGQGWAWCTGALIARSIILTAGHCVHQGGNRDAGWIEEGYFVPGFSDRQNPSGDRWGRCDLLSVFTTDAWWDIGNLHFGYDVALAVCDRPTIGPNPGGLIGWATGWLGFCYENCRWPYVQVSQFGYPGNYFGGGEMTVSHHLNETVSTQVLGNTNFDYAYGSGMRGGSSGGPHVINPFQMREDSSPDPGQFPDRNIAIAVTSWGFIAHQWKIQGASPLSGVANDNNFPAMFNRACRRSRNQVGNNSCPLSDLLPE